MDENIEGLDELSRLTNEIEDRLEGELPRRVSAEVSGDRNESGDWNHVNVRIVDPEEGVVYERDYPQWPTANQVVKDYHAVA